MFMLNFSSFMSYIFFYVIDIRSYLVKVFTEVFHFFLASRARARSNEFLLTPRSYLYR